jgi:flagella basal body P-ring formation protein FlgA
MLSILLLCAALSEKDFTLLVQSAAERSLPPGSTVRAVAGAPRKNMFMAPLELNVTPLTRRLIGKVPARVDVTSGEKRFSFQVVLTIDLERAVLRLTRDVRAGEVLSASDLVALPERMNKEEGWASDPAIAVGRKLRVASTRGTPITEHDVERVPVVHPKDPVRVVVRTSTIVASAPGEAQQAGAEGENIRVINLLSSKQITARVVSAGVVEVFP